VGSARLVGVTVETSDAGRANSRPPPPRGTVTFGVVWRACRPLQWIKNALLLAAPLAAGVITHGAVMRNVAVAVVAFCLVSSATYLLNDVRDREQDRVHPRKRLRPIASGALPVRVALAIAVVLAGGGLAIAALVRPELAAVCGGYLLLMAVYSLWLRRVIVADILVIAAGFVARAAAGGVAAHVGLSAWFLVVVSCGAIFVVAAKRHAELLGVARDGHTRATLRRYSAIALRAILAVAAAVASVAYAVWAFGRPQHGPWYEISVVPVVLWLCRYGVLVGRGEGEAPEELILRDRMLLALTVIWTGLFLGGVYVGR
jgi:decaprenyl-phosphate phosphoribosyltransferase